MPQTYSLYCLPEGPRRMVGLVFLHDWQNMLHSSTSLASVPRVNTAFAYTGGGGEGHPTPGKRTHGLDI